MDKNNDARIERIFRERPTFHQGETEVDRKFSVEESLLSSELAQRLASGCAECYGIDLEAARFIANHVDAGSSSLETGAGLSTLVFALQGAHHLSITPNGKESEAICRYAAENGIRMDSIRFVNESSDKYLPTAEIQPLDFVLLDGKHAFPWPVIDWFYTVDRIKQGGVILIDDVQMVSVRVLVDFMAVDPRWQWLAEFNHKTYAFRKMTPLVHDVAWHMQPYVVNALKQSQSSGWVHRISRKIKGKG